MTDPVMQNISSPDEKKDSPAPRSGKKNSLFAYTAFALGLALFIRFFIAAPYVVSGASMEPTFENWDYLIIDRISYDFSEPKRGDVVVFDLPQNESRALIKRVIGLPGDTVVISGPEPTVTITNAEHPEGLVLKESYLDPQNLGGFTGTHVTLEPDEYFVLGDNRRVSSDSRVWGVLPRRDIVGRVLLRLYPFGDIGVLPGEARYSDS